MRSIASTRLLSPEFFIPLVYLAYVLMASLSYHVGVTREFLFKPRGFFDAEPSYLSYLITLLGVVTFSIGASIGKRFELKKARHVLVLIFFLALVTVRVAGFSIFFCLFLSSLLILVLFQMSRIETKTLALLSFSIATLCFLTLVSRGIPLLQPSLREEIALSITKGLFYSFSLLCVGFLSIEGGRYWILILSLLFFSILTGFKADVISIILTVMIVRVLSEKIKLKEALGLLLIGVITLTLASTVIAKSYYSWRIPPVFYPLYRAGFTFLVFDKISSLSFPLGHDRKALFTISHEFVSKEVLGYSKPRGITTTLLGPAMLSFGVAGVVGLSFLLGFYLGVMRRMEKVRDICLYAIALSHLAILVEIGTQLPSFLFLLSMLYLKFGGRRAG